ncbi:hypothetical protein CcaverHIS002_0505530 [Cutaneotrichosporon cavernicola]|uniref:mRNA-capping enzyme subunit alpha n=1 Tax=Cutaneotrichosporon cavernicola TaxID=279322 RepID=A0AA48L6S3_9TREE|nr:uncharacterized protein CcaverHIS019_0506050 [Cutaneotrichosporon cavernicola]BEI85152.1 hypothetical protein CcaverHIS002_0505530 [Cutaneotrichosporon cavernicola]BEI92977.1 hypothetical protein CcaverHIS019_0506050 [Cutaneotrichosporon cavernicola]BEJ00753.1 hypothetical protein CcaverHIS631_0506100 [Cutaneotrichosporon cavernicola]BEJ08519.1 hypothetical protein CcaverHIS641_0506130 [Cutaneotrichosporon cavernicola]
MATQWPIPEIPGVLLRDPEIRQFLNNRVAHLCGRRDSKFPGAQPVSFAGASLDLLEKLDFWVCEKSDGVRVLLFIVYNMMTASQEVWLIDRKQRYFSIQNLHFTHWERPNDPLADTILDGELVIDIDPLTKNQTLRFYAFDCLVLGGENIMTKPLVKRYARLRDWVIAPMKRALQRFPEWKGSAPFEILAKPQELSYCVRQVLETHIPNLQHGHDGLIFTCAESEYVTGTDPMILKWKPPSENSIDFRIDLRFPVGPDGELDMFEKPFFLLNAWMGGDDYEFFDEMDVDDDEWEIMKDSREQYDGRIVECVWNAERQGWRMMRVRDDKPHANHKSTVDKVLESILDGVEIDAVLARQDSIRAAWKERAARQRNAQRQPHLGQRAPPPPPPPMAGGIRR